MTIYGYEVDVLSSFRTTIIWRSRKEYRIKVRVKCNVTKINDL